jgi:translation initiation factor eIF-2B subunit beta
LTFSTSETLTKFFIEASKTVPFELIVLESAPNFEGHKTAKRLAEEGIKTNLVQDAAVFAIMSRVDKVMISAHGIMANGGLVSHTGALMIAYAAKEHKVPLFVVGALYKLTPLHPIDSLTYNEFLSPDKVFRQEEEDVIENIDVVVPLYDYVPPKLVSLILTN